MHGYKGKIRTIDHPSRESGKMRAFFGVIWTSWPEQDAAVLTLARPHEGRLSRPCDCPVFLRDGALSQRFVGGCALYVASHVPIHPALTKRRLSAAVVFASRFERVCSRLGEFAISHLQKTGSVVIEERTESVGMILRGAAG